MELSQNIDVDRTDNLKEGIDSGINQIRELAKLKDEGVLSEEEFTEKKKALLEKI